MKGCCRKLVVVAGVVGLLMLSVLSVLDSNVLIRQISRDLFMKTFDAWETSLEKALYRTAMNRAVESSLGADHFSEYDYHKGVHRYWVEVGRLNGATLEIMDRKDIPDVQLDESIPLQAGNVKGNFSRLESEYDTSRVFYCLLTVEGADQALTIEYIAEKDRIVDEAGRQEIKSAMLQICSGILEKYGNG